MPLEKRDIFKTRAFSQPISYRVDENRDRLRDASNVFSNQNRLETRFGMSRFNDTSGGGSILSCSYFKKSNGTRYYIAKIGTVLYKFETTGAWTSIKTGLSATTKHTAKTFNDRHIIACEADGLFAYDGTNFYSLGQAAPSAPTVAASGSGATLPSATYRVKYSFYSTTTGFETNGGAASANQAITLGQQIDVSAIAATATNPTIDRVRIYLQDVTNLGAYLFIAEQALGVTTATITAQSTSTMVAPTANGEPLSGGAMFLAEFNRKLITFGNPSYPNDGSFSETNMPDAFDQATSNRLVLHVSGNGKGTGLAVGQLQSTDGTLEPYAVFFKAKSTSVYSEIGGISKFTQISDQVGCVCHNSIMVKNGDIYFLGYKGWHRIHNGNFIKDKNGDVVTLGLGDIDDIFHSPGYVFELNKSQFSNFFGCYYQTLDQYICWVAEGSGSTFIKSYVYEFQSKGFKSYTWTVAATCCMVVEDSSGDDIVLFGDANGYFYKHSIKETQRSDVDTSNTETAYQAFAQLMWRDGDDYASSYDFRDLIIRAVTSENDIDGKSWVNYNLENITAHTLSFPDPTSGFVLDLSELDEATFSDEREIVQTQVDINRSGYNILLGFYQQVVGGNLNLISAQLNGSKNGNNN